MSYARQMLGTYRQPLAVDAGLLAAAIDTASDCAQACAAICQSSGAECERPAHMPH